jgi:hypothetical protein
MITDKPNYVKKHQLDLARRSSQIPESISDKIKYHFKCPNEKYPNPLTSSQEFGWDAGEKLNKIKFNHPKLGCDVTKYADEYYALKGRSPYASKDPVMKEKK